MEILLYEMRPTKLDLNTKSCGGEKQVQIFMVGILYKLKKEKVKNKNRTCKS
jgi:hypothetical protein